MNSFEIQETHIRVQPAPDNSQWLYIEATPWGKLLAQLLGQPVLVGTEWQLVHSRALDARLCQLTDFFIALRYQHPTLLQLELLPTEEGLL